VYDGLTVLDLSWGAAGPMTTMFLADHGATVTRIVPPGGDPFAGQSGYRVWNRGKRSAHLDLKSERGRDALLALASTADLVVESFAFGTTARLGLDHATLSARNQRLITLSISAYGGHPDHADRPGYDALVAARTGLYYDQKGRRGGAMEFVAGRPGPLPEFEAPDGMRRGTARPGPVFPRTMWPSIGTTYVASLGIAAALRAREVTGRGQHVRTSLMQGALAAVALNWQRVEHGDAPLYWMWPLDSRAIEGLYECADGRWVHHWTVRPKWVLAAAEADRPQEAKLDTPYRDDPDRIGMDADGMVEGTVLHPLLVDAFKKFSSADWIEAAAEAGIGMALVRSPAEALADPAFLADGCVVELDDPEVGRIRCAGPLMELSATPGAVAGPTRASGVDTEEVLAEADGIQRRGAIVGVSAGTRDALAAGPLTGIRVLDLGLGVAGPFTGRMLADLGADVIKVMAMYDGFWAGTHMGLGTNRGKRSIALDLKHPEGRAALERLVARADVLTLNWRPGAAARLGLDFDTLHGRYPRLVWCNTRGFEKGPRSDLPGTDQTAAALTGTEWEDGAMDTGNPPLWSRSNMGDTGNALLASIAITAALYHRDRTGVAQAVSTSIVNAGLLHTSYAWIDTDGKPVDWGALDAEQTGLGPGYRMYRGADDRWVFVAALDDATFATFSAAVTGRADADADALEAAFATRPAREWWATLDGAGVPAEIVDEQFCRTLFDDPHARATGLVSETRAPGVGRFEDPGLLIEFSDTPGAVPRGPCLCGEHTRELLREHGYSDDEIDALAAEGAVLDAAVDRTHA
jgi:crotonobetainyl-CoA:carnitine CoA-transferase CaiB-like acyl-CoA transferase